MMQYVYTDAIAAEFKRHFGRDLAAYFDCALGFDILLFFADFPDAMSTEEARPLLIELIRCKYVRAPSKEVPMRHSS